MPRGGWRRPGCGAEASRWKYFAPDALWFPGNRPQGFLVLSAAGTGARRAPFARPLRGSGRARCHRHRRLHRAFPSPFWRLPMRGSGAAALPQAALYPRTEPDCLGQHEEGDGTPSRAFLCSPSCLHRDTPGERSRRGLFVPSPLACPLPESGDISPSRRASVPAGRAASAGDAGGFLPGVPQGRAGWWRLGSHTSTLPCATCSPSIPAQSHPGGGVNLPVFANSIRGLPGWADGGNSHPAAPWHSLGLTSGLLSCQPHCPAMPHPKKTLLQVLTLLGCWHPPDRAMWCLAHPKASANPSASTPVPLLPPGTS